MTYKVYTYNYEDTKAVNAKDPELRKAIIFAGLLCAFFFCTALTSLSYMGPIVLGTEMNTNGHVEYLCLFDGCEDYTAMTMNDKG